MKPSYACFVVLAACGGTLPLQGDAGDAATTDGVAPDAPDDATTEVPPDGGPDAPDDVATIPTMPWAHVVIPSGSMFDLAVDPTTKRVSAAGYASSGSQRFVLVTYDAAGVELWKKNVTPGVGTGVALDAAGNVYAIGSSQGIDLGGGTIGTGPFCVKFDASGVWQWQYGPLLATYLDRVRVAPDGTVLLAGELTGSEDYGGGTVTSTGPTDAIAIALDASGHYVAAQHWGTATGHAYARALAVDSTNAVYLAGTFEKSIDFGGGTMTAAPSQDGYIAKLSTTFAYVNQTQLASTYSYPTALAVDATDHLLVGIGSTNAMTLGGASVPAPTGPYGGIVLAKLDSSLSDVWFKQSSGTLGILPQAVGPTPDDGLVATGYYAGTIDLGKGALPTAGTKSLFAVRLDSSGSTVASVGLGQNGQNVSTEGYGIAWIENDDVVTAGDCMGSLALPGMAPVTCTSSGDAVVARFQLQ
jgi:hypothetical protein